MGRERSLEAANGRTRAIAWLRRNAVAMTALFVALGGTGYAASAIDGGQIKNATITGKKLKKNTLGGREVRESKLGKVPRAARADSARPTGIAGGDLRGSYPNPSLARAGAPINVADNPNQATDPCFATPAQTLVLCGTSSQRWTHGGLGIPGLQVWKDRVGEVHVRGSATITAGTSSLALFRLPASMRPKRIVGFPVVTGDTAGGGAGGSALLFVYPTGSGSDGLLGLFQQSQPNQRVVHLGEIVFRIDA